VVQNSWRLQKIITMLRKVLILVVLVVVWIFLFAFGCQKKEEIETAQNVPATPIEIDKNQVPSNIGMEYPKEMLEAIQKSKRKISESAPVKKGHAPVVVPADVQKKWKAVVIEVANKQTKDQKDYVVDISQGFIIPNTKIRLNVVAFLPDFSMSAKGITSRSNELRNPAAKVVIYEDGTKIFEGWLFQKLPTVHPFVHKVYAIRLKGEKSP